MTATPSIADQSRTILAVRNLQGAQIKLHENYLENTHTQKKHIMPQGRDVIRNGNGTNMQPV